MIKTAKEYRKATPEEISSGSPEMILIKEFEIYVPDETKEVALWKLRAILSIQGLLTRVDEEINKLTEPNKTLALMSWEYGTVISNDSPTVKFIQGVLGLTDEQVNNIFDSAESLKI